MQIEALAALSDRRELWAVGAYICITSGLIFVGTACRKGSSIAGASTRCTIASICSVGFVYVCEGVYMCMLVLIVRMVAC